MTIMVAPTEPSIIKSLGVVSPVPETLGVDVLWTSGVKRRSSIWCGVQRKEFSDLIQSLGDRLTREIIQMKALGVAALVIEGRPAFTQEGELVSEYGRRFTRSALTKLIYSIQSEGVWVIRTASMDETVEAVLDLKAWTESENHTALQSRKGPDNEWGQATIGDWKRHFLQGIPGIGPKQATKIIEHFGGLPLDWTVTEKDLLAVPGLGPGKVSKMMQFLGGGKHGASNGKADAARNRARR